MISVTRIAGLREPDMAITGVPEDGDIVIRCAGRCATPDYLVRAVPGPDQLSCATRAEAETMARAYALHAQVDVWVAQPPDRFTLMTQCRASVRERSRPAPAGAETTHRTGGLRRPTERRRVFRLDPGAHSLNR